MILKWLLKISAFAIVLLVTFIILLFVLEAISQANKFHFNSKQLAFLGELKQEYKCKYVHWQDWEEDPDIFIGLVFNPKTKEGLKVCESKKDELKKEADKIAKKVNKLGKIASKYTLTIGFEVIENPNCQINFEFRNTE